MQLINIKVIVANKLWGWLYVGDRRNYPKTLSIVSDNITEPLNSYFLEQIESPIFRDIKKVLDSEIYDLNDTWNNI